MPRRSVLKRPDPLGQLKPIASNIDYIVIVIAPTPQPHTNLIDRYLAASEHVQIKPVILLNKIDLIEKQHQSAFDELLGIYPNIGYQLIEASTKTQHGLAKLERLLNQHTSVFVGQSGVGKSSLINALLPGSDIKVGEMSKSGEKGTHTTTTAKLFHLLHGGALIDSPGIREFNLWHMDKQQLLESFVEFRPYLGLCKFRDCQHEKEPQCALLEAIERGEISRRRMESFCHILFSLEADD